MKTRLLTRLTSTLGLLAATVLVILICASAPAQTADPNQPPAAVERVSSQPEGPQFDLEVSNGRFVLSPGQTNGPIATVGNLIKRVQELDPNVNIILSPGVADVALTDFRLHAVTLPRVLTTLPGLTGNRVGLTESFAGRGRGGRGSLASTGSVYMVGFVDANVFYGGGGGGVGFANTRPVRQVEVFNINNYLNTLKPPRPDPASATERAVTMNGVQSIEELIAQTLGSLLNQSPLNAADRPDYFFHEGTGLFVVVGSPQAIDVASKIISALPGSRFSPARPSNPFTSPRNETNTPAAGQ